MDGEELSAKRRPMDGCCVFPDRDEAFSPFFHSLHPPLFLPPSHPLGPALKLGLRRLIASVASLERGVCLFSLHSHDLCLPHPLVPLLVYFIRPWCLSLHSVVRHRLNLSSDFESSAHRDVRDNCSRLTLPYHVSSFLEIPHHFRTCR